MLERIGGAEKEQPVGPTEDRRPVATGAVAELGQPLGAGEGAVAPPGLPAGDPVVGREDHARPRRPEEPGLRAVGRELRIDVLEQVGLSGKGRERTQEEQKET